MTQSHGPFHAGELRAQTRAGVAQDAAQAGRFIRDFMPDQHRAFFSALPFLVIAGADNEGRRWVSLLETAVGSVRSDHPQNLYLPCAPIPDDPMHSGFTSGARLGVLGIELATRRRNRVNGRLRQNGSGFVLEVAQSFGNCPQYIHQRDWHHVGNTDAAPARTSNQLTEAQARWIASWDTFFIGSGIAEAADGSASGFDASHRGGSPGFVEVMRDNKLRFPDYAGNNFFNTIGNLLCDPRVGLLFVDFENGGLLHVTGRAEIVWDGKHSRDPQARREVIVTIDKVVERQGALSLRWHTSQLNVRRLRVVEKRCESRDITSFHLAPLDGAPLPLFLPGQHLPIELHIPGQATPTKRSYSLSGAPAAQTYRISVKREDRGLASAFMHDQLEVGDVVQAREPSGDFVLPSGDAPLVLASAGVGVTPMVAMLYELVETKTSRPVFFVQGVRDGASYPFQKEVAKLASDKRNIRLRTCFSAPRPEDFPLPFHAKKGRVTALDLLSLNAGPDADFMLCGPVGFIASLASGLEKGGIRDKHIHYETFGPAS